MINNSNNKKIFFIVIIIALLLVFLNFISRSSIQNNIIYFSSFPAKVIEKTFNFVYDSFRVVFSLNDILKENSELKNKNKELQGLLVYSDLIKKENKDIREQFSLRSRKEMSFIDARVVSFDPNNFSKFITINKGAEDGVDVGDSIVLPGNILLARVSEVYDNFSKAVFLTDKNNKISVKSFFMEGDSLKRDIYTGVLNGYFGKSIFLDLVEKNAVILKGDTIVTSGIDSLYPEGLIVGYVDVVKNDDNAVFKKAYLRPAFFPFNSNFVFVVKSN